uniref:Larval cuticle protein 5 n=1 Tax=Glossina austeni TaxID=7395 RepID=A0A1A9VH99_GLOAU
MKFVIVLVTLFAIGLARPDVQTVRNDAEVLPESFHFGVETNDGTRHDAEGHLKVLDKEHATLVVKGSYQFVAKDGHTYTVDYVADENGYQAQGAHLPHNLKNRNGKSKLLSEFVVRNPNIKYT